MRLDGFSGDDWQRNGARPDGAVRVERANDPEHHFYVAPALLARMIAATDTGRTVPVGGRGGGEPVDHPPVQAPAPATIAAGGAAEREQAVPPVAGCSPPGRNSTPPAARSTDPATSHTAAAAVTEQARRDIHRQVLAILAEGPASDFDLAARTGRLATSVGCRRNELVKDGLVEQHDRDGVSATGSPCLRWRLTDAGWAAA